MKHGIVINFLKSSLTLKVSLWYNFIGLLEKTVSKCKYWSKPRA